MTNLTVEWISTASFKGRIRRPGDTMRVSIHDYETLKGYGLVRKLDRPSEKNMTRQNEKRITYEKGKSGWYSLYLNGEFVKKVQGVDNLNREIENAS